jgi:SNF-related kinase/serine kinase
MYIVFEYATGGSLFDFILKTGTLSEQLARHYFNGILEAVSYLHSSGIAHHDIKPQNILLNSSLEVLLADFDLASPAGNYKGVIGTCGYMAPEIEARKVYSAEKADIFALGVVLFFMVIGKNPFTSTILNANYNALWAYNNKFWKRFDKNNNFSIEFKSLIERILERDPDKRITLDEMKKHLWMQRQPISELELIIEKVLRKERLNMK